MADQKTQDNLILNNRPPDLTEDFGITDEEDKLDKILMPDKSVEQNKTDNKEKNY